MRAAIKEVMGLRRALFGITLCGSLAACSAILGIGDLPAADDTAGDASGDAITQEAGDGGPGDGGVNPNAPRLISPLSTARVSNRTPTLKWLLPTGVTQVTIDLCSDRACANPLPNSPFTKTGSSFVPPSDLSAGVVFWRVRPIGSSPNVSATWEFTVTNEVAGHSASWGTTLDINGDGFADLAVGAPGTMGNQGSVFVYFGSDAGIVPTDQGAKLQDIPDAGPLFGQVIASAGDLNGDGFADLAVSNEPGQDNFPETVAIYLGSQAGPSTPPAQTLSIASPLNVKSTADFGSAISSAGDVNGDGYGDLIIGASNLTTAAGPGVGEAYIFMGGPSGIASVPTTVLDLPNALPDGGSMSSDFSNAVSAGDFNGDGYGDVAVAASESFGFEGAVFVYLGSPSGISTVPTTMLSQPNPQPEDLYGVDVAGSCDVNGDGYSDLLVAQYHSSGPAPLLWIYFGGPSGVSDPPDAGADNDTMPYYTFEQGVSLSPTTSVSVACLGDTNGDGFDDMAISGVGNGLFIFHGGTNVAYYTAFEDHLGVGVSGYGISMTAADLNRDGNPDLTLVSAGVTPPDSTVSVFMSDSSGLKTSDGGLVPDLSFNGTNISEVVSGSK